MGGRYTGKTKTPQKAATLTATDDPGHQTGCIPQNPNDHEFVTATKKQTQLKTSLNVSIHRKPG